MNNMNFVKGMAVGVIAGAAIGVAVMPKTKTTKRFISRALRTAGDVVENVSGMWS